MKSRLLWNPCGPSQRWATRASSLISILHYGSPSFNRLQCNTSRYISLWFDSCSLKHPSTQTGEDRHLVKALMKGQHVDDEQAFSAADKLPVLGLFLEQLTYYLMRGLVWMRIGPSGKWITCPSLLLKLSIISRPKWSIMLLSSKTRPSEAAPVQMLMLDVWKCDFSHNSEDI